MAFSVSATLAVDNATPKVGQRVTLTLTIDNSGGTIDYLVSSVQPYPVSKPQFPMTLGFPQLGSTYAGDAVSNTPLTVAAGSTAAVSWSAVLHCAGAVTVGADVSGTRADTGIVTTVAPSAVTITAS